MRPPAAPIACRHSSSGGGVGAQAPNGGGGGPSPPPSAANANAAAKNAASAPRPARRRQENNKEDATPTKDDDNERSSLVPKPAFPGNGPSPPPPPNRGKWLVLALAPIPALPPPPPPPEKPLPFFRYWVDSQALSSSASTVLLERALVALGGRRTGGPPKLEGEQEGLGRRAAAELALRRAAAAAAAASGGKCAAPLQPLLPSPRDYGYMHMGEWDFLWSITAKAMIAAELLRPRQLLSVVPGCLSISRKTSLCRSLVQAYGPSVAFGLVVPLTFKLPEELDAWGRVLASEGEEGKRRQEEAENDAAPSSKPLWMLKNNKQRGTGLRLVSGGPGAFEAAFETAYRPGKMAGIPLYRWYLAQRYVSDPLLLRPYGGAKDWIAAGGAGAPPPATTTAKTTPLLDNRPRKFGLRLWALVPSAAPPFRAYIHTRGLALFSSRPYTSDPWAPEAAGADADGSGVGGGGDGKDGSAAAAAPAAPVPEGHLTNAARNAGAPVWPLSRVAETLGGGGGAWPELWERLCRSSALALASSARRVRERRAELTLPAHSCFQLFGLDFVVDANLQPWLLEVNATPSMRVDHPCPSSARVVEEEKWPAVWDALAGVMRVSPERFSSCSASSSQSSSSSSSVTNGKAGGGRALLPPKPDPHAAEASLRDVAAEMARSGGYVPLTHLFPDGEMMPGCSVPWTEADDRLRSWLRRQQEERRRRGKVGGGGGGEAFASSLHAWRG